MVLSPRNNCQECLSVDGVIHCKICKSSYSSWHRPRGKQLILRLFRLFDTLSEPEAESASPVRLRKSLKKSEKSQSQLFTPWHCLTGYGMKRMLSMWHSNFVHPTHSTAEFLTNERHIIAFLSPSCHTKPANIQILMDLIELIDNTITSPVTDNDYKSIMLNAIVEHNFALTTANHNRSVGYW